MRCDALPARLSSLRLLVMTSSHRMLVENHGYAYTSGISRRVYSRCRLAQGTRSIASRQRLSWSDALGAGRLRWGREIEVDDHHRRVLRIGLHGEAQTAGQGEHAGVLGQHEALHALEPSRASPLDECAHQPAGQASSLPAVRDGDGKLAELTARQNVVARAGHNVDAVRRVDLRPKPELVRV